MLLVHAIFYLLFHHPPNQPPIISIFVFGPSCLTMEGFMISEMAKRVRDILSMFVLAIFSKVIGRKPYSRRSAPAEPESEANECLSWRLAVEANNMPGWSTVPLHCLSHVETYMMGGQYEQDVNYIVEQIENYVSQVVLKGDGCDAWILDIDDTCISNLFYYKDKNYGCDPFDPGGFVAWVMKGECPAIPAVLGLFTKLVEGGFKVFLLTGRDQQTLAPATIANLHNQGFIGYHRVIFRNQSFKGKSAVVFKSEVRKQLVEEGYRIWGNVGDQWTDLQGECLGNRTFKIPNPMYCVP
ncbi:hypothetical protein Goklo_004237 [Gossypium klotzschianum]|uniref:Acid phosphatase 1 n=2 Tax=Gossypium TaxID=3633 RepID=A0A7J8VNK8_9ROSI|nr:hypothetical protein [Gossypium klotzschianum]